MFLGTVIEAFDEFAWISAPGFLAYVRGDYRDVQNADVLNIGEAVSFIAECKPGDRRSNAVQIKVLTGNAERAALRTPIMPPAQGFSLRRAKH